MRGISLGEISASTKIGTGSLRAIEEEDFAKLPGGIFNKGFVRAYSRFLGLDEEQTVADFEAAWTAFETARGPVLPTTEEKTESQSAGSAWLLVVALTVLGAIAAGWYLRQRPRLQKLTFWSSPAQTSHLNPDSLPKPPLPAATDTHVPSADSKATNGSAVGLEVAKTPSISATPAAASVPSPSPSASNAPPVPSSATPIHLQVFARQDSWLSVSVDGKDLGQGILSAQKSRSIRAQKEVRLKVGNLAGVQVSFNGEPVDVDGQVKEVKELIFTAQGLQR